MRSNILNVKSRFPALLVESAAAVNGPYVIETGAFVEPGTRRVTIPQNGGARYYRLRWDHAVLVTSITLTSGNVVLAYQ